MYIYMDIRFKPNSAFGAIPHPCTCCKMKQAKYICPRCKVPYCGIRCYKAHSTECAEEFYKEQVIDHLTSKKPTRSDVQKVSSILKSVQEKPDIILDDILAEQQEKRLTELDSITENPLGKLTYEEELQFASFIDSGEVLKYIEEWNPWWISNEINVEEISQSKLYLDAIDIKILHKNPSPFLVLHIFEVIWSSVYSWRSFNGDIRENARDALEIMLKLSKVMKGETCKFEQIGDVVEELVTSALGFDREIALAICNGVLYDCYLIFSSKWALLKMIFEVYQFLQIKNLSDVFFSITQIELKRLLKKLNFFVSYIKMQTPAEIQFFSEQILDYYTHVVRKNENSDLIIT